jgi:glucose-6-phosphate-specific signal transduction histidine kinase
MYSDLVLSLIFVVVLATAKLNNTYLALLLGFLLNCQLIIAHNFFHRKDNWRMLCFNLSGFNYTEWRIR